MAHGSLSRRNFKGLTLQPVARMPPTNVFQNNFEASSAKASEMRLHGAQVDILSIGPEDLEDICELGFGNSGAVRKVLHKPSGLYMAKKSVYLDAREEEQRLIVRELTTLKTCDSDFIVRYYGQFLDKSNVIMCMEFMDCGSLDRVYRKYGPLSEDVLVHVNAAVVDGLVYLKNLQITHRDIKPSNILVNHLGQVKLCDLGVSGVLINSMAQTYVGTSVYMSPERIQGEGYTDAADVWSLGLTLVELARGKFPIIVSDDENVAAAPFEILQSIVEGPTPTLPEDCSAQFKEYVAHCLEKDPAGRIKVRQLSDSPFYVRSTSAENPLAAWAAKLDRF